MATAVPRVSSASRIWYAERGSRCERGETAASATAGWCRQHSSAASADSCLGDREHERVRVEARREEREQASDESGIDGSQATQMEQADRSHADLERRNDGLVLDVVQNQRQAARVLTQCRTSAPR